jgi:hypothetical protein
MLQLRHYGKICWHSVDMNVTDPFEAENRSHHSHSAVAGSRFHSTTALVNLCTTSGGHMTRVESTSSPLLACATEPAALSTAATCWGWEVKKASTAGNPEASSKLIREAWSRPISYASNGLRAVQF